MKVGDTVRLKSGGPLMTVSSLLESNEIMCTWFNGDELKSAAFPIDTVEVESDTDIY